MVASTDSGTSIPVFQFISEAHDSITIASRLQNWAKDLPFPKEIVIDGSAALLLSVIRVFTQFNTTRQYLDNCHNLLNQLSLNKDSTIIHNLALPTCYIRNDVAHIVKTFHRSKVFNKVGAQIKTFYLNAVGLLFWVKDFYLVKTIVKCILTLCKWKFRDEKNVNRLQEAKDILFDLIKTHTPGKLFKNDDDDNEEETEGGVAVDFEEVTKENSQEKKSMFWFDDLNMEIEDDDLEKDDNNKELNMYYFLKFIPYLKSIIYTLPLWGAVMVDCFKSPIQNLSSANQESAFSYIKNNLFKFIGKQRADAFIIAHINDLIGALKIAVANLNTYKLKTNYEKYKTLAPPNKKQKTCSEITSSPTNCQQTILPATDFSINEDTILESSDTTNSLTELSEYFFHIR